jgi:hypothetical protein
MDARGSEEIDFEIVTNKVTLLSVALTDITRQIEREAGRGTTDLNAVSAQLTNLHAKIGEDSLLAAWGSHADPHFVRCFHFSRHACRTPRSLQGKSRVADSIVPNSLPSRRCPGFESPSWQAASLLGSLQLPVDSTHPFSSPFAFTAGAGSSSNFPLPEPL